MKWMATLPKEERPNVERWMYGWAKINCIKSYFKLLFPPLSSLDAKSKSSAALFSKLGNFFIGFYTIKIEFEAKIS